MQIHVLKAQGLSEDAR